MSFGETISQNPKVLIVDDRAENLLALEVALRPLKCEVVSVSSGREAIRILATTKVAAVILDVQMPDMDGYDVAEAIRDNPTTEVTPVILTSAYDLDNEFVERAYESGATAVLTKPINQKVLLGKIGFFIKLFERIEANDRLNIDARTIAENERAQLIESSLDAVVGVGANEEVLFWNRCAETTFGWSKEEALGRDMAELIVPPEFREMHRAGMRRFIATGKSTIQDKRIEVPALTKSGTRIDVELTVTSVKAPDGTYRFYSMIRDITDRNKWANELKLAKEDAERANRLKSFFLASMSHEIRTPLGAMLGFAELIRDSSLSPEERNSYLDIIARNGQALSMIINDVLDLSKVEAGKMALEFSEVSLEDLVAGVMSLMSMKAKEKKLALDIVIDPECQDEVVTDALRTRQVLLNLVGNAIKFTPSGFIRVEVSSFMRDSNRFIAFDVRDSGIGVAVNEQERIFEAFTQAEDSTTRRFGGTGLGLALSRRLADSLGGELILAESTEGRGSCFRFVIKDERARLMAAANGAEKEKEFSPLAGDSKSLKNISVLVVDDSADNQLLIRQYLTKFGAQIDTAVNGLEGVKKALNGHYDIVLMDINMPEMDGYTATQELRAHGFQKPIIALTAHAMGEVRRKCFEVGCTAHLTKPINAKDLIAAVYGATH